MSQMWESSIRYLMRAGQTFMMSNLVGRPSSLRTWKNRIDQHIRITGISLLLKFMRNFLKFLVRWFMKLLWSISTTKQFVQYGCHGCSLKSTRASILLLLWSSCVSSPRGRYFFGPNSRRRWNMDFAHHPWE
jgi:hypothetical protein